MVNETNSKSVKPAVNLCEQSESVRTSKLRVKSMDNNELFRELLSKQLKNVSSDKKLQYTDLKRICKYINSSLFDENNCCLWHGYVTNGNNNKGTYVNFYFRKKKAALHRLLYVNFVGELLDDEYLKFNCEHRGKCCNINHLKKFKYQTKKNINNKTEAKETKKSKKNNSKRVKIVNKNNGKSALDKLHISFD